MGEMLVLMGAADICFMGGSLIGDKVGGHNVLEPAALGVPVITGPSYYNFKEIVDEMIETRGTHVCNAEELPHLLVSLLQETEKRAIQATKASDIVNRNAGALHQTITEIISIH